jgi:hypothetical protein
MQILVSQNDRHLLAFGCVPYGSVSVDDFDPLLIRWADQDNPQKWSPAPTNSAGDIRISRGSAIIRALATRQEVLVWTNSNLYALQFLGTTDVFGLQELADNISIIGPRSCIAANNVVYWMGQDKFYAYSGRVETLPCTLRNYVFLDLNYNQADQIVCGTNEGWNEIWWFYPTANSNWNNAYVVYNHLEKIWYYGTMVRTAWLDIASRQYPQAVTTQHKNCNRRSSGGIASSFLNSWISAGFTMGCAARGGARQRKSNGCDRSCESNSCSCGRIEDRRSSIFLCWPRNKNWGTRRT